MENDLLKKVRETQQIPLLTFVPYISCTNPIVSSSEQKLFGISLQSLIITQICLLSLNTQYVSFKQEIKELELIHQSLSKYLKQDAPEIQRSSHNKLPSL